MSIPDPLDSALTEANRLEIQAITLSLAVCLTGGLSPPPYSLLLERNDSATTMDGKVGVVKVDPTDITNFPRVEKPELEPLAKDKINKLTSP